jgi:hypothetical protein
MNLFNMKEMQIGGKMIMKLFTAFLLLFLLSACSESPSYDDEPTYSDDSTYDSDSSYDTNSNSSGSSSNSDDYNADGEYKPVESMTQEEIEQELTDMLEDAIEE